MDARVYLGRFRTETLSHGMADECEAIVVANIAVRALDALDVIGRNDKEIADIMDVLDEARDDIDAMAGKSGE